MTSTRPRGHAPTRRGVIRAAAAAAAGAVVLLAGCSASPVPEGRTELLMWTHAAGNPDEIGTLNEVIADFNASQDTYFVRQEAFPQLVYNDAITAAALTGDLPCLVDIDGPIVPNWAWAGLLRPLDLPDELVDQVLPSAVGEYRGQAYSVGYWDAALSLHARKSVLDRHGVRIPTMEAPWTREEFDDVLETLAASGEFTYPLDLGTGWTAEWWSYAYSPFLQSFGGDQVDRDTFLTAQGALNGPEAVEFGEWFQSLFTRGYANREGSAARPEFRAGDVALSWTGSWEALNGFDDFGDDMLLLPPPDLGNGPTIGGASWQWGVSTSCEHPEGAFEYLAFSMQPRYIAAFSDRLGVIPSTDAAAQLSEHYGADGKLRTLIDFSREYAVIRPPTPAYQVVSSVFEKAMKNIMHGADVQASLDRAVREIDTNITSNDGYGFQGQ